MSNIGFMQHTVKYSEMLWNKYMNNPRKSPTKQEKEHYLYTLQQLEIMYIHNEIEDKQLYDILLRKLKQYDLTRLVDYRKKLKKAEIKKKFN